MENTNPIQGRFKDAKWANAGLHIVVGGAGGIGSWLTFFLSRLGDNQIVVYDDDEIEIQNVGGQLYPVHDVGSTKLHSLYKTVQNYSSNHITTMEEKYTGQIASDVMFSGFDNMVARKQMSEAWYDYQMTKRREGLTKSTDVNVFIDGRMEAEQAIIYIVDSISDYKKYQSELFEDDAVQLGPCTFRATTHNAAIIAGNMVAVLANVITNKIIGGKFRTVPYKITYELPTLTYSTEL